MCAAMSPSDVQRAPVSVRQYAWRADWVRAHERHAICMGLGALFGGALRVSALCTLAAQLDARAKRPETSGGPSATADDVGAAPSWGRAYLPFGLLLGLTLCCTCCCFAVLPPPPKRSLSNAEHGHAHENGHELSPSSSRRREAIHSLGASGSSEGTSPLLPHGESQSPRGRTEHSPHLL